MKRYIPLLLLLCSCSTSFYQKRDIAKLDALAIQQQTEFKRLANLLDPCFTATAKSDTVIKFHSDTITTPGFITISRLKDTIVKTVTLPGKQVTTQRIVTIRDTIPDNRALTACGALFSVKADSLNKVKAKLEVITSENTHKLYWIIGLALALLISWALTIYFKL
jgi:hypothetical protein